MARILVIMATLLNAAAGQSLYDRFFDEYYFPFQPTTATFAGVHRYDARLEDYSRGGVEQRIAALQSFYAEFAREPQSADRDLVWNYIRGQLLELETIRMWQRDPDRYSSGITMSAFSIMSRSFADPEVRLRSLIARERAMPAALAAARVNLLNPPRIYTEIALEQLPGNIAFFENDVPQAFQEVKEPALLEQFREANAAVIAALRDYEQWLRTDLLPRSTGDFRLGAEIFARKLLYDEMVDLPLDRLLEIGYQDLRRNQQAFAETARLIDPNKTPRQILDELERDHPRAEGVLDAFRASLDGLKQFIEQRRIVTIPSQTPPIVQETPPFMRALTFASMDTPGPYETKAKEAFFNVTLPQPDWPADRVENFLRGFHRGTILATAIHEAYPGHYTQFLWMQRVPSRVRKLLGASSNAEGWAHYAEQMILDEGYGGGDPRIRLGQLQDALLRNARYIVGIEMHTGKRSFEEAVEFFQTEGYQTRETAERETKRGTSDPTYLYYTLGKLQILKLREDYQRMKGAQFSLEEFHNRFMQEGFPPIRIVRKALLGDDSPTL
jgi:hypothetical protein